LTKARINGLKFQEQIMGPNKFKAPQGKYYTNSLFLETSNFQSTDKKRWLDVALFTLKDNDVVKGDRTYPSARRLFVETGDPTGYTFAEEYCAGWKHYQTLIKGVLADKIEEWLVELEICLKAEGIKKIRELAKGGNRQAMEWLAQGKWKVRKAGAPSKAEKEGRKKQEKIAEDSVEDDYDRVLTKREENDTEH